MLSAYVFPYLFFLLKILTIVVAIALMIIVIAAVASREKEKTKGKLIIKNLNKKYLDFKQSIQENLSGKKAKKLLKKEKKEKIKKEKNAQDKKRLFVLNFCGDVRASDVHALSESINAVLLAADFQKDQVLLQLESPGGMVHAYGLAAMQLQRLRDAHIHLTIAVDKVAASGGYMMACVANKIIAAPFAIMGSIGVIAQLPNFNRFLKSKSIDFEQIKAGQYKRTLSVFGENTKEGREKVQEEVNETQVLFKEFIHTHRPQIDLEKTATGEHWFAKKAIELNLVDELMLSDDFILKACDEYDIYSVEYKLKKGFMQKFGLGVENTLAEWMR